MSEVLDPKSYVLEMFPNTKFLFQDGALYSMEPAESMFGFTYHSYMIPPFKPEHTLILGYGYGTIAALMRKVYGSNLKITGVDQERHDYKFVEHDMKIMDAEKFVKDCSTGLFKRKFDYIVVDLWNGKKVCDFVYSPEFVVRLKSITKKMVSVNGVLDDFKKMKPYHDYGFSFLKNDVVDGNIVSFWK